MNETEINESIKRITQQCASLLEASGMSPHPTLNDYKSYFEALARDFKSNPDMVGQNLVMSLIMSLYGLCHIGGMKFTDLIRSMDKASEQTSMGGGENADPT